jgi:LPS-assembly lipoprotein
MEMTVPGFPPSARWSHLGWILLAALSLSGCFRPLYGSLSGAGGATVAAELQAIAVDPIPDRIGHYLGNELIFGLNGTGSQVPPKYHLLVTATESVQTALIDTLQQRATAGTLVVIATYRLVPSAGGAPITTGSVTNSATYDRFEQRFTDVRAAKDAEIRVANALADMIKTRIAAYFATRG